MFENAETWRAKRIASTEASRAVHDGRVAAAAKSGVVSSWNLLVSTDACEICQQIYADNPNVTMADAVRGMGSIGGRELPPFHPNCYCSAAEVVFLLPDSATERREPVDDTPAAPALDFGSDDRAAEKWLATQRPTLALAERLAVANYGGAEYRQVNAAYRDPRYRYSESTASVRRNTLPAYEAELRKRWAAEIATGEYTEANIKEALKYYLDDHAAIRGQMTANCKGLVSSHGKYALPQDIIVYRGAGPIPGFTWEKGATFTEKAWASTSAASREPMDIVRKRIASGVAKDEITLLKIKALKGTNAILVPGPEAEVLLGPGTQLKITNVTQTATHREVEAEIIKAPKAKLPRTFKND